MNDSNLSNSSLVEEAIGALMRRIDALHSDFDLLIDPASGEARVSHWGDGGPSK